MNEQEKKHEREAYQKPELVVYGDIREITKSINKTKGDDGAPIGNSKTS